MPTNVLHILGTGQPEGTSIARIVGALGKGLDPQRYRLCAWFLAGDGPLAHELRDAGVEASVVDWSGGSRDPAGAWRFSRALRGKEFVIIHQHWGGRAPRWLARKFSSAKVITHLHAHLAESEGLTRLPFRLSGADLVIATSRAVADNVEGSRIRVVYPGVNISNGCDRPANGSSQRGAVLGTAGRLVPLKGIVYLIRALTVLRRVMPGVRLEVAGSGPERPSLEREAQLHDLGGNVSFLGWQMDLSRFMAGWDLYVQPSLGEPFGVAALEAMAAGLPVVCTAAGGLPEFVEHGRTGWLVPPRDPAALADRVCALLLDPEQRRRMGAAGRARVREHFSEDRMVRAISKIYDEVLTAGTPIVGEL